MSADDILGTPDNHPSYGSIKISCPTTNKPISLFGSSIKHGSYITITICRAEGRRKFGEDGHYSGKELIEVNMSPVQFATMVTTAIGHGNGVPCTISYVRGEPKIERPRFDSKQEQFANEFKEDLQEIGQKLDGLRQQMENLMDLPTVSKAARKDLLNRINSVSMEIKSNMPFMAQQFSRQMARTVHEAKAEVEAHVSNIIRNTGLETLANKQLTLTGNDN